MKLSFLKLSNILGVTPYNLSLSKYLSKYFKNSLNLEIKTLYHLVTPSP
jgi:hypothetical protein